MRPRSSLTTKIAFIVAVGIGLSLWRAADLPAAPVRREQLRPPQLVRLRGHALMSAPARPIAIGAAGDIACESPPDPVDLDRCRYDDTADLLTGLAGVLVLGDGQYESGELEAFRRYYQPTWGRYLARTYPAPGNHEYTQDPRSAPTGYFQYFGDRVRGPDGLGYYSVDLPRDAHRASGCVGISSRCRPNCASPPEDAVPRPIRTIRARATGCTRG